MKKRLLSVILVLAMCLSLLPTVSIPAAAAGTDTAIQLGAPQIEGGQADSIYFGTYKQSSDGSGGYHTDPIKWRVLSNASKQLFLLSDQNLDVFPYHKSNLDDPFAQPPEVTWESSTMRSWLNGYGASSNIGEWGGLGIDYSSNNFLDTAFSEREQGAIAETAGIDDRNPYFEKAGNTTTDKVFLLSLAEVNNESYFADQSSRIATNTAYVAGGGEIKSTGIDGEGIADFWWLRTLGGSNYYATYVWDSGYVAHDGVDMLHKDLVVRPAFHLDLNAVLFTSAADNTGHNSSFAAPAGYSGNEWKVTLKDGNDFSANASISSGSTTLAVGCSDATLTISHAALSSFNEGYTNVTAMLTDASGNVLYYGSINSDASATQSPITIPAGLTAGTYTLSVYGETWNGKKLTDYATGTPFRTSIDVRSTHNYQYAPPQDGMSNYFEEGCSCGHRATATVNVPTISTYYDGQPKEVSVTFGEGWTGAQNVTVAYYDASSNKLDAAPINAGTYTFRVTVNDAPYDGANATFTIGEANATDAMKAASGEAKYGRSGSVDLSSLLPSGCVLGTISTTDNDGVLDTSNVPTMDNNGILSFTFVDNVDNIGKTATIIVPVTSSTNYNPYEIAVTVKVLAKYNQTLSFTEAQVTKTYGAAPFTITANHPVGDGKVTYKSSNPDAAEVNPTTGKVTIKKVDAMPVTITATAAVTDDYFEATAQYSLKINQKELTVQPKAFTVNVNAAVPSFALAYIGLVPGESLTPDAAPEFKLYKRDGTTEITAEEAVKTASTYIIKWTNADHIMFTGGYENNYSVTINETANLVVESTDDSSGDDGNDDGGYTPPTDPPIIKDDKCERTAADNCPLPGFADLDASLWYHDGIHYCIENGLMGSISTTERRFSPDGTTTRAQIVTILWRMEGSPVVNYLMDFEDVAADLWYTEAVRWAQANGIVLGYEGKFSPNDPITREQLAAFLYRYARHKGGGFTGLWMFRMDYVDLADVSDWAYEPMCWCVMNGIITGIERDGSMYLDPQGSATRAQAAVMLQRFCENMNQ